MAYSTWCHGTCAHAPPGRRSLRPGSSDLIRRDPDGNVLADTRASKARPMAGTAVWGMPLSAHTFQNVDSEEFRTLTVEMKGDGGNHANGAT